MASRDKPSSYLWDDTSLVHRPYATFYKDGNIVAGFCQASDGETGKKKTLCSHVSLNSSNLWWTQDSLLLFPVAVSKDCLVVNPVGGLLMAIKSCTCIWRFCSFERHAARYGEQEFSGKKIVTHAFINLVFMPSHCHYTHFAVEA